ncbi:acyltransferase [Paenibacillus cisolokensis]|uniref:acyltransferase n=1 Tax=Paenibacillus cisolokensis TaxID=1658519 RepID=UPI003D2806C1
MLKRERLNELDLVRAMAIVCVIMVHATSSAIAETTGMRSFVVYNFFNIFFRIGTPIFIFLSSFVLFYNYYHQPFTKEKLARFFSRRFMFILIPYVIFSIVFYLVRNYQYFDGWSLMYTLEHFGIRLLTGKANAHLYFVIINIQFYLMFPIFLMLFKKSKWLRVLALPLGFAIQWAFVLLNAEYFHLQYKGSVSFSYMSYFFLGAFLGIYFDKFQQWFKPGKLKNGGSKLPVWLTVWALWAASAAAHIWVMYSGRTGLHKWSSEMYDAVWNIHTYFSAIVMLQAAFYLYHNAPKWSIRMMAGFGSISFGVYLFHPLVLHYYRMTKPDWQGIPFHLWYAGGFVLAVLVSWLVVGLVTKYFKWSWLLFGSVAKQKTPRPKQAPGQYSETPQAYS